MAEPCKVKFLNIIKLELISKRERNMASNRDLRRYLNDEGAFDAFSKLVSGGKAGYKTVIERKKEALRCSKCRIELTGEEKFCPECGTKTEWQKKAEEPEIRLTTEEIEKKFKSEEMKEPDVLAYLRDNIKLQDNIAFDLINKWRKEIQEENPEPKIDLDQFKG